MLHMSLFSLFSIQGFNEVYYNDVLFSLTNQSSVDCITLRTRDDKLIEPPVKFNITVKRQNTLVRFVRDSITVEVKDNDGKGIVL